MKLRTILTTLATAACILISSDTFAQKKGGDYYNYQRAIELMNEKGDPDQILDLLSQQLKVTPDDPETLFQMVRVYRVQEDYSNAISAVNRAIKVNKPKKSGIPMSTLYWWKGHIYDDMDEFEASAETFAIALELARKDNKEKVQNISFDLGGALYTIDKNDEALAVYNQMMKEDESDVSAMTGAAMVLLDQEKYKESLELSDRAVKFAKDYADAYRFRLRAYDAMGETDKAIDDAIRYFDLSDSPRQSVILPVFLKHKSYAIARIKMAMKNSEDEEYYRRLIIRIYEESNEYENAIKAYNEFENDYGRSELVYYNRAQLYDDLGLFDYALADMDKALEMEEDYLSYESKGCILRNIGRYDEAVQAFTKVIDYFPTDAYGYYARGWCYELSGDIDKALEDYDLGIDIDDDYPYIYLKRGEINLQRGETEKANKDFERILQIDTLAESSSCRQYALHFLGKDQEALEWMDKVIENDPDECGNWYDKACVLAIMGRGDEAVKALEKAFEMGYVKFAHIVHDADMDGIRDREDFKALFAKYEAKLAERIEKMGLEYETASETRIIEVPITRHGGGTFDIKCTVNGLPLDMIFDTGASDVSISKVEADFMLKNKYLSRDDIKGKQYYQTADGGISEGTIITLKEVKIGDAVLHNVNASVSKSQSAPLLLGESVLRKFGTFTVDNINSKLIIQQ